MVNHLRIGGEVCVSSKLECHASHHHTLSTLMAAGVLLAMAAGWRTAEDQHNLHTIRRELRGSRAQDIHAGGWGLPGDEQGLGYTQQYCAV
jgi:hypothetical protein